MERRRKGDKRGLEGLCLVISLQSHSNKENGKQITFIFLTI